MNKHTFVVCAYKESPYLEECIRSLENQTVPSHIILVTSTPNSYIEGTAKKHGVELFVNEGPGGITQDWNFGYRMADAEYVTIAHQDDVYRKDYLERALKAVEGARRPLIFFSDYYELREGKVVKDNTLLRVKRLMLVPLRWKRLQTSRWVRRRILSFGSPICCPSFVYDKKALMCHRIHPDSETSAIIGDNARSDEEFTMYCKFWPKWFARILNRQYAKGQKSNNLGE